MAAFSERLQQARLMIATSRAAAASATTLGFGKHKGMEFEDIWDRDIDYCKWCLTHLKPPLNDSQQLFLEFIVKKVETGAHRAGAVGPARPASGTVGSSEEDHEKRLCNIEECVDCINQRILWMEAAQEMEMPSETAATTGDVGSRLDALEAKVREVEAMVKNLTRK